ncbi:MAG TPA: response regulator, partial [Candidatus Omnitrophota bacterium]|nr:response regulator [Candidatus Omnitrophota bacterium]
MDSRKILVVDDEQDLTFLISEILQREAGGHEIHVVNSGEEAMRKFVEIKPDVVFLDYIMPDVKGDDVLEFINNNHGERTPAVILMSGLGERIYFKNRGAMDWSSVLGPDDSKGRDFGASVDCAWRKVAGQMAERFNVRAFMSKPFSRSD